MSNLLVVKETPQYKRVLHEKALYQASTRPGARLLILFVFQVTVHTCPDYLTRRMRRNSKETAVNDRQYLERTNPLFLLAASCKLPAGLRIAHRAL